MQALGYGMYDGRTVHSQMSRYEQLSPSQRCCSETPNSSSANISRHDPRVFHERGCRTPVVPARCSLLLRAAIKSSAANTENPGGMKEVVAMREG